MKGPTWFVDRAIMRSAIRLVFACLILPVLSIAHQAAAQPESEPYTRTNSFGLLAAYSPNSSHMFMGAAQNRMLLQLGGSYSRRLIGISAVDWQYDVELLPIALESDPVVHTVLDWTSPVVIHLNLHTRQYQACKPNTTSWNYTIGGKTWAGTQTDTCERTWSAGMAFSPVGMRWNFRPRHKLQPFVGGHGGLMYTSRPIPIDNAGSFNFTFDFDAGLEFYHSARHSFRAEYRYHHISNHDTAPMNPGIDNGLFQLSYVFGR